MLFYHEIEYIYVCICNFVKCIQISALHQKDYDQYIMTRLVCAIIINKENVNLMYSIHFYVEVFLFIFVIIYYTYRAM